MTSPSNNKSSRLTVFSKITASDEEDINWKEDNSNFSLEYSPLHNTSRKICNSVEFSGVAKSEFSNNSGFSTGDEDSFEYFENNQKL